MADGRSDHFLKLALSFGKLVLEVMSPVSKQDHRARVVIVLNIYHAEPNNIVFLRIGPILFIFGDVCIRVDQVIETVRLTIDQGCLNIDRLFLQNRVLKGCIVL